MNEYNWKIEHQCPQCGAPVVLDEADRLLFCPFCRTKLYLTTPDHFRYHIPAAAGNPADMVYVPYWRLKGNCFSVHTNEVTPRFVDTNILAAGNSKLPISLGLRPQAMNMKFTSPDMPGRFLKADVPAQGVAKALEALGGTALPGQPYFYRAFIGEMISLIYSPAYIEKDALYDAFTRKRLMAWPQEDAHLLPNNVKPPNWQIRFISTLCPRCGWDMDGAKDAIVMICRNCDSVWFCPKDTFEPVPFSIVPSTSKDAVIYLPFWRMTPRWEGITLSSYADLIRVANLPKAIQNDYEKTPVYFWSPAFKVNPALFLRLTRQMTMLQPDVELNEIFGGASIYPITLSLSEAVESIMITFAGIVTDKRRIYPELVRIKAAADAALLVYYPFRITLREFIHLSAPLAIDRQALNLGTHL